MKLQVIYICMFSAFFSIVLFFFLVALSLFKGKLVFEKIIPLILLIHPTFEGLDLIPLFLLYLLLVLLLLLIFSLSFIIITSILIIHQEKKDKDILLVKNIMSQSAFGLVLIVFLFVYLILYPLLSVCVMEK